MQKYMGGMATSHDRQTLRRIVAAAHRQGVIITTHDIPDADGIACCLGLLKYLSGNGYHIDIVTGPTIHRTDPLVEMLGIRLKRWADIAKDDLRPVIVVDTNTYTLLSSMAGRSNPILAEIDHHKQLASPLDCSLVIKNQRAISVCEILASLIPEDQIDRNMALALAVGIESDSERLLETDRQTIHIFERLMAKSGVSKFVVDALAYPVPDAKTLTAMLLDMRRLRTMIHREKVICVGKSSQEVPATLAMTLKDMGVNISAAISNIGTKLYKVSFRVCFSDVRNHGIAASDIAMMTSDRCGMPKDRLGGGHMDKAGAVIEGTYTKIVDTIFATAREVIDQALDRKV